MGRKRYPAKLAFLFIVMLKTCEGSINLAVGKPASQSSEYSNFNGGYPASLAVNGNTTDFSHTANNQTFNWWMVDLRAKYSIEKITIHNRFGFESNLKDVTIWASNSLESDNWQQIAYRKEPYPTEFNHTFDPPIEAQYVNMTNSDEHGIAFAEVKIYDKIYSKGKTCTQSSTRGTYSANNAVDGNLDLISSTRKAWNSWWKVDLGKRILFREVKVSAKSGSCNVNGINEPCYKELRKIYYLTAADVAPSNPTKSSPNVWSTCLYEESPAGENYTVQCDQPYRTPVTRHFSLFSNADTRIELRQLEVYGSEMPQLSTDIQLTVDEVTSNSITVSFLQWNKLMVGGLPPTDYAVRKNSEDEPVKAAHLVSSNRRSVKLDKLYAWKEYTINVSCLVQDYSCPGNTYTIRAKTNCSIPDKPGEITFNHTKGQNTGRERWIYTITWKAPEKANCGDELKYSCSFNDENCPPNQRERSATFFIDGSESVNFAVWANNSIGSSTLTNKSETSGVLNPQFGSSSFTLTADGPNCVTLDWSEPEYPGGQITRYQFKCDNNGNWINVWLALTTTYCNYQPYTTVTCQLRARNSAGWSRDPLENTTTTLCTEPSPPLNLTISAPSKKTNANRIRWQYTARWEVPSQANCNDPPKYIYGLQGVLKSSPTSGRVIRFYLEGDEPYDFVVAASNSKGHSEPLQKNGTSDPIAPQFKTSQPTLTANDSSCVILTWTEPAYPGGTITQYQYQCDDGNWETLSLDARVKGICSYLPYTETKCRVRAYNSAGNGSSNYITSTTLCDIPPAPRNITFSPSQVQDSGRIRWRYNVAWLAPARVNCNGSLQYRYGTQGSLFSALQPGVTATFYLDGNISFKFIVVAVNSADQSESTEKNGTAEPIVPQFGSSTLTLTAPSPYYVSMSWVEPQHPGGTITHYEYKCDDGDWNITQPDARAINISDYQPFTQTECQLRAVNAAGNSTPLIKNVRTLCAVPSVPQKVSYTISNETNDNRQRWKYDFTWQAPSQPNCNDSLMYTTGIKGEFSSFPQIERKATFYLDGNESYTFIVKVENSKGDSKPVIENGTADPLKPQFGSTNVTLTSTNATCVKLVWSAPQYPGGFITHYRYKCDAESWETTSPDTILASICGYQPSTETTCQLQAHNSAGFSIPQEGTTITNCTAPSMPREIDTDNVTQVTESGRYRWKYVTTWMAPSQANCNDSLEYKFGVYGNLQPSLQSETVTTFYLDGNETYELVVAAMNSVGPSKLLRKSGTSPAIAPQFGSVQLNLTAVSPYCVKLLWLAPEFPGGTITLYQYRCDDGEWTDIPPNNRTKDICNYQPFTETMCELRARNSAGPSEPLNGTARTPCAEPSAPQNLDISFSNVTDEDVIMWRYIATWQAPSQANCNDSLSYKFGFHGTLISDLQPEMTATFKLHGNESYNFTVVAKNSIGYSTPLVKSGWAHPIKPQFGSKKFNLTATSSYCVQLAWEAPEHPGGIITKYQYKCDDGNWKDLFPTTRQTPVCDYKPYTQTECTLRAGNSAGWSDELNRTTRTPCAAPDFPEAPKTFEDYDEIKQRRRIVVTVEGVVPNCASLKPLMYKIANQEFSTNNYFTELNATTKYEIKVQATNNLDQKTETSLDVRTGELAPWDPPEITKSYSESGSCVVLVYDQPVRANGVIVLYQYRCTLTGGEFPMWTNTTKRTFSQCDYLVENLVECMVRAATAIGIGPEVLVKLEVQCGELPKPSFALSTYEGANKTAVIEVDLKELQSKCPFTGSYSLKILNDAGSILTEQALDGAGKYQIRGADPFTTYTVIVAATFSDSTTSETNKTIFTVETAPWDGPSMWLSFTDNCVLLHIGQPDHPNGELILYNYRCWEISPTESLKLPVLAHNIDAGEVPEVCDFLQVTKIFCSAQAVNLAGESPETVVSGYTHATVTKFTAPEVMPADQNSPKSVIIKILPVELEYSSLNIRSYVMILTPAGKQKREVELECDKDDCYIAEIANEQIKADGYTFYIGDGKEYGGYVNKPLRPAASYTLRVAIYVEAETVIYQVLDEMTTFTAPSSYCEAPPDIENAVAGKAGNYSYGDTVAYSCDYGFQRTRGDLQLKCALTEFYLSEWVGTPIKCSKALWIGVGVGVGALFLIVLIPLLVVMLRKRCRRPSSANSTGHRFDEMTYIEPLSAPATPSTKRPAYKPSADEDEVPARPAKNYQGRRKPADSQPTERAPVKACPDYSADCYEAPPAYELPDDEQPAGVKLVDKPPAIPKASIRNLGNKQLETEPPGYEQPLYEPLENGAQAYEEPENQRPTYEEPDDQRAAYEEPENQRPTYEEPDDQRPAYEEPENKLPICRKPEKKLPTCRKPETRYPTDNYSEEEQPIYDPLEYGQPAYEPLENPSFTDKQPSNEPAAYEPLENPNLTDKQRSNERTVYEPPDSGSPDYEEDEDTLYEPIENVPMRKGKASKQQPDPGSVYENAGELEEPVRYNNVTQHKSTHAYSLAE